MNRIVTTSVAGLGVLASLTFAGSTNSASTGGGAARATTTNAHLVAVHAQPPVATVTMPGDAHGTSVRCVSIASTSCGSEGGSGVTIVRTSHGSGVSVASSSGSCAGTGSCGSVSVAGASGGVSSSASSGGVGLVGLTHAASSSGGVPSRSTSAGPSASSPRLFLAHQAPATAPGETRVARVAPAEAAEVLDLRSLMARARGSNPVDHAPANTTEEPARAGEPSRLRTRVVQDENGARVLVLESVGDEADDEPCLGASEEDDVAALEDFDADDVHERIQEAMEAARESMEMRRDELEEVLARARDSAQEAQERTREALAEAHARMRADQEAARESQRRAMNGARAPRGGTARVLEVAPRASAQGTDAALESRIEALERAARARGDDVGGPDRSLEERVAQLERSMNRASEAPGATGTWLFSREASADAELAKERSEAARRAELEARFSGQRRRSSWSSDATTLPVPATPPTPPTAPSLPRTALAPFFAPAAPTPPAAPRATAQAPFGRSARSANDDERRELENAMQELRSEAARLRAEVERMRAEIDRLPRSSR